LIYDIHFLFGREKPAMPTKDRGKIIIKLTNSNMITVAGDM
jgi:hypothetical protein